MEPHEAHRGSQNTSAQRGKVTGKDRSATGCNQENAKPGESILQDPQCRLYYRLVFKMLFMGKSFRADDLNQALLLPPSLHDWLPETHLARFLVDVVAALDLGSIYASYESKDGRGQSAYAPETMLRVLLYGYATGVYSSRKFEARTYEDVAFRYLSADTHPDRDTIATFRKRHLEALAGLFVQALLLCEKAGLVKLGDRKS